MSKDENQELRTFDWKRNPSAPTIYSNYLHIGWTLEDVRVTLGALRSDSVNDDSVYSEEQGSVILGWRQAKNLRDMLQRVVAAYEAKNGVLETPLLADVAVLDRASVLNEEVANES
jgi:uncharacterized protein DUF3467